MNNQIMKRQENDLIIALGGNPNVGKSTIFNGLTGLRQHTGNWPGKTVSVAQGYCVRDGQGYCVVDLPGCYALTERAAEEELARDFICHGNADAIVLVCDATCMERSLTIVLQALALTRNVVVCVNLLDEAATQGVTVDLPLLSQRLGVAVVGTTARDRQGLHDLLAAVSALKRCPPQLQPCELLDDDLSAVMQAASALAAEVVAEAQPRHLLCTTADRLLLGKWTAFPLMLLALLGIFWLTISGSNYPSKWLSDGLFWFEARLHELLLWLHAPPLLDSVLVSGVYRVVAWVVAVMLPPMAIFFPLFTLLEDIGILPRIAFALDKCFQKCAACGKQALSMCMGFGCNAVGVVGCRIIESPRERLLAMITNSFVPCNGRFPTLIALISIFCIGSAGGTSVLSAVLLTGVIMLGIGATLLTSRLLSKTLLKGLPSSFVLELPPYRRPQIGRVVVRSLLDRTLFVLGRAICVAAPAGLLLWVMANVSVGNNTLLLHCAGFLDPFARVLGLDGIILLAFILGFPANEIVLPIIVMAYTANGTLTDISNLSALRQVLVDNGWTWATAISVMLFSLMHWPCSTTCWTIYKESRSLKWTAISMLVPTIVGMAVCALFTAAVRLTA